jgi:hypothetical protein
MMISTSSGAGAFGGVILLAIAAALYFLPLIVAILRKVPNVGSVAVVNIFLGWTFIGWVVALAMACRSADRNVVVNQYGGAMNFPAQPRSHPPAWLSDPSMRHQLRYWDGIRWTEHVSDNGASAVDPVG